MELFLLYIWMKLGTFIGFIVIFSVLCWFTAFICALQHNEVHTKTSEYWILCKKWFIAGVIGFILALVVPTQNQVAVLVGTHYALELGKSPEGQKIVSVVRMKANKYLDEQLQELADEAAGNKVKK